jgi:hypothetical protein
VRPSAFAVLRRITSSNFVGAQPDGGHVGHVPAITATRAGAHAPAAANAGTCPTCPAVLQQASGSVRTAESLTRQELEMTIQAAVQYANKPRWRSSPHP